MNNIYKHKVKVNFFGNTIEQKDIANLHHFQYLMNYNYLSPYTFYYSGGTSIANIDKRNVAFSFLNSKTLNELFLFTDRMYNIFEIRYSTKNSKTEVLSIGETIDLSKDKEHSYLYPNFTIKYGDRIIKNTKIFKPTSLSVLGATYSLNGTNDLKLIDCSLSVNAVRNEYTQFPFKKISIYKNQKTIITVKSSAEIIRYSIFGGLYNNGNDEVKTTNNNGQQNNTTTANQTQPYISNVELKSLSDINPQQIITAFNQVFQRGIVISEPTEKQLIPLRVHNIKTQPTINNYRMNNNKQTRFIGGSGLENDELSLKELTDNEICIIDNYLRETSDTARFDITHDFELTDDEIIRPFTLTYIDNTFTKKTVSINYSYVDFFREILKNSDGYTNTLPLEHRYFIGHNNNRGEVFNIGKWVYSSTDPLNTENEYTDITPYTYLYSLFDTYKEQDDLVYLYNTMLPDMWFHIYYLLITTMQIPELKTHSYKLPSLYTVIKLIHEYHTAGKHKYLYFAFLSKFIATAVEQIYVTNPCYTKKPAGDTSIFNQLMNHINKNNKDSDPFTNSRTSNTTNSNTIHHNLLLSKVIGGVYDEYVNDLNLLNSKNSVDENAEHLSNYIYKQILLINIFSGYDKTNALDITPYETSLKYFIKKNLLSRYFVYMNGFTFNRNGIMNKYDNNENFNIHCDYGMYIPYSASELNKISVINSADGRLLYDFKETVGTGIY